MSDAGDSIIHILSTCEAPVGGWDMPSLRRLTGLSVGAFAGAVSALRSQGKMLAFDLALTPSAPIEPVPMSAPTLAEQIAAEAQDTGARRKVAASTGRAAAIDAPSPGALLQERALNDAPALAASIMKDRWGPVWNRVCRHAQATNQRPIAAMIALLDRGLNAGEAA
ncbi:hypothetical protein [Sphingobium yanoikuyae]|uniref:Uncharacterized protein n=1 Tax=Sphingobium yanoikuyae TaxID=13690 RepID=A0A3G2UUN9_SPHYA|nr:hypothetical protein [Sphingobium yanoikuyae]AYO78334.1 hypothetical protein EBF16_16425 [Sphingobium yanoikuyae]